MLKRLIFVSLTLSLYSIALTQWWQKSNSSEKGLSIVESITKDNHSESSEKIIFKEGFVNNGSSNTISHVSSITPVDENRVIAVWYSGSTEGAKDVAILMAIYDESKGSWSDSIRLVDRERASRELRRYVKKIGNPMLMRDSFGKIWLFYSSVIIGGWSGSSINYKTTLDGIQWSESRKLILSPFFNLTHNIKNDGVNLSDGSILIPAYSELFKKTSSLVWINERTGQVRVQRITQDTNIIQPVLIPDGIDKFIIFFRNTESKKERYIKTIEFDMKDNSFSEIKCTELPNPNSGFDMIKIGDTTILSAINNSFDNRGNLLLFISFDKGKTWRLLKILEDSLGKEYSYPSITRSISGLYHLTYTYERKRIKHIIFNEEWIKHQVRKVLQDSKLRYQKTNLSSTTIFFYSITQKIVLSGGCILFLSVIMRYLIGIIGVKCKDFIIILTSVILIFISQLLQMLSIGDLSIKDLILSINPWFSVGSIVWMLYMLFKKRMDDLFSDREISFFFFWTLFCSFFLSLSNFGFIKFDLYRYGYDPSGFFIVLFLLNICLSILRSSISVVLNLYIITYIAKIIPSGNIFDAITDGIAIILSLAFLLWQLLKMFYFRGKRTNLSLFP